MKGVAVLTFLVGILALSTYGQEISSDSEVEDADHDNAGLTHQGLDVIDQVEDVLENTEEHIGDVVNSSENDDEVENEAKTANETEDEELEAKAEDLGADDIEDEPLKAVEVVESSVDKHEEVPEAEKSEDESVVVVLPPETRVEEQEIKQPDVMKDEKKILTTTMKYLPVVPAGSPQKTEDPGVHSLLPSKQRSAVEERQLNFKPMQCYACNSAFPVGKEVCNTPLPNPGSINLPLVSQCDSPPRELVGLPEFKGGFCRIVYQSVSGDDDRTIRGCGWLLDEDEPLNGCKTHKSSSGTVTTVCNCNTGDKCNTASNLSLSMLLAFLVVSVAIFV
ncbi:uncharacterized protein LOC136032035 [Artemia franciscana]|uniref:uncharacterized protein LOC136032035 n=1 Tax=Artemia franciscana TaxID=6661 RepID=UPI0032DA6F52